MAFPDAVAIKYGVFTLCCHKLVEHLQVLNEALRGDTRLTVENCIGRFNSSLREFCQESKASSLVEAVEDLNGLIGGRAGLIRRQNPAVAEVFDRVAVAMAEAAPAWRYEDDIEAYHHQGQELARRFYEESPWTVTRERLSREARLVYDYGLPDPEALDLIGMETFGYRAAPLAYRPTYYDEDMGATFQDVIVVRFLFDYDFALYLAYPFLFLHEYTAHIYATDYGNDCFNDGWMLHAVHDFLWRLWMKSDPLALMLRQQASIFHEHLYGELNPIPRGACGFARDFNSWLSGWAPGRFKVMTHELAAFMPRPGEGAFWPTQFIKALEREFEANRIRLRQKIEAAPDARTLWSLLTPI